MKTGARRSTAARNRFLGVVGLLAGPAGEGFGVELLGEAAHVGGVDQAFGVHLRHRRTGREFGGEGLGHGEDFGGRVDLADHAAGERLLWRPHGAPVKAKRLAASGPITRGSSQVPPASGG